MVYVIFKRSICGRVSKENGFKEISEDVTEALCGDLRRLRMGNIQYQLIVEHLESGEIFGGRMRAIDKETSVCTIPEYYLTDLQSFAKSLEYLLQTSKYFYEDGDTVRVCIWFKACLDVKGYSHGDVRRLVTSPKPNIKICNFQKKKK